MCRKPVSQHPGLATSLIQVKDALGVVAHCVGTQVSAVLLWNWSFQGCLDEAETIAARQEHGTQVLLKLRALELGRVVVENPTNSQ